MRIGIKIDSAEATELRSLLSHLAATGNEGAMVGLDGPEKWTAETEMLPYTPLSAVEFLRGLADRIEKNAHLAAGVDPQLERLLAEEEEIQRGVRDETRARDAGTPDLPHRINRRGVGS